jgi:hypothetical protein
MDVFERLKRLRTPNGETRTLLVMLLLGTCFFGWLDYRELRHDEISVAECADLNTRWQQAYQKIMVLEGGLKVSGFECPTSASGLSRGLKFLQEVHFEGLINEEKPFDFWGSFVKIRPVIGDSPAGRFAGLTTYGQGRIDINPTILERGNPVEVASILVHELRHLEEGRNTHVPCLREPRLTCDDRLAEPLHSAGAYNHGVLFLHQVMNTSQASAQDKRTAARLLVEILENRFNHVSAELRDRYEP